MSEVLLGIGAGVLFYIWMLKKDAGLPSPLNVGVMFNGSIDDYNRTKMLRRQGGESVNGMIGELPLSDGSCIEGWRNGVDNRCYQTCKSAKTSRVNKYFCAKESDGVLPTENTIMPVEDTLNPTIWTGGSDLFDERAGFGQGEFNRLY